MKMTTSGTEINKNHRGANVNKTAEMTRMALMVAMNCVSAYIIIPLPFSLSPIALQTLIVNLTGYVLNAKQAFMTMLVYLLNYGSSQTFNNIQRNKGQSAGHNCLIPTHTE